MHCQQKQLCWHHHHVPLSVKEQNNNILIWGNCISIQIFKEHYWIYGGIQKNMHQFEMQATMEWLVGKVTGGTTECGNIRSLQLSQQCTLCKMVYSTEECVLTDKTVYQSVLLWQCKESWGNSTGQKFEVTGNVRNNKKGYGGKAQVNVHAEYCSCMWSTASESEYLWHNVLGHSVSKDQLTIDTIMQQVEFTCSGGVQSIENSYSWCSNTLPP
jgi:hypothetical protein